MCKTVYFFGTTNLNVNRLIADQRSLADNQDEGYYNIKNKIVYRLKIQIQLIT